MALHQRSTFAPDCRQGGTSRARQSARAAWRHTTARASARQRTGPRTRWAVVRSAAQLTEEYTQYNHTYKLGLKYWKTVLSSFMTSDNAPSIFSALSRLFRVPFFVMIHPPTRHPVFLVHSPTSLRSHSFQIIFFTQIYILLPFPQWPFTILRRIDCYSF